MKVNVAYVAPLAFAAGAHVSLASAAVATVFPLAMADSPPFTTPSSAVPPPFPSSTQRVPADAAWKVTKAIASSSTSVYPNSEAVKTWALSSFTVTVKSAAVGRSCTAFTVIATVSTTSPASPSLTVKESWALLLLLSWLVQVTVAIALLTLAVVPEKVMVLSLVPSPALKVSPVVVARENVALCVEATVIVSDESSMSATVVPVIVPAVSSLTVRSLAVAENVGASLAAVTLTVIT